MSERLPDWEERLGSFLAANMDRAFVWGEWDCALFATACAAELTGDDRAAAFRGAYDSKAGAARALRERGQGTLLRTLDSLYDAKPVGMAQRGDLVWHDGAVGVCNGHDALFIGEERLIEALGMPPHEGLIRIDRARWSRAWAV